MSSKKTGQPAKNEAELPPGDPPEIPAESGTQPEAGPGISQEEESLIKRLDEAQAQAAEYKDGWQRAVADFQNYRKRLERENSAVYQNAVVSIIRRYLPILDDLELALASRPADQSWADGIELIYRKWQAIMDAEGVKRIEAEGEMFDPNLHEAISQEPSENHPSGQVIHVVRNGYTLGECIIRPAQVRVAQ